MFPIILFDGECHFCNGSVRFIIKRDVDEIFYFAPLQSPIAKTLLKKHGLPEDVNSLVLIEKEQAYIKSSAVLRVCSHLNGVGKISNLFKIVPKRLLDCIYDFIAQNRYKWFGVKNYCEIYPEYIRKRFLTD